MTLQEVIDRIKMIYPSASAYEDNQIIGIINDIQRRIFRTMYKPETATTYDILADNPFYPVSFQPESIIDVVVDGKEYPSQNIEYDAQSYYYYITEDNSIGIYPTPTEDITNGLTVFHYKESATLSAVTDALELDAAWHMLLVYGTCAEFAMITRDDMYSVFATKYNEIERQYYKSNRARPHRILDVYGVGRCSV